MCQVAIKDNFCGTLFEKYGFLKNIFDLQKDVLILCFLSLFKSKCRWKQNVLPEINYLNDPTFFVENAELVASVRNSNFTRPEATAKLWGRKSSSWPRKQIQFRMRKIHTGCLTKDFYKLCLSWTFKKKILDICCLDLIGGLQRSLLQLYIDL